MTMGVFHAFLSRQLGFPTGWFGQALLHLLNRANGPMNDQVLNELQLQADSRVLEIGFGGGDLIQKIVTTASPSRVIGIERSPTALKTCQHRFSSLIDQGQVELHLGTAAELPFGDCQFSHICTVNTIYFWPDTPSVLTECQRVLQPGGRLILCYASKAYLEQQKLSQNGFIGYAFNEVEAMLKAAGFSNIKTLSRVGQRQQEFFCTSGEVSG